DLLSLARLKVLKFHPNLPVSADFDFQFIQAPWRRARWGTDLAAERESAVMAGAVIAFSRRNVIDETTEVRTNHVKRLACFLARASQINGADRCLRRFVPGISAA